MRRLLLWLLIVALPVYGASSSSLRLLGPAHWHSAPAVVAAPGDDWLQPAMKFMQRVAQRVQQLRDDAHARAHAYGKKHEHHGLQRHWHDAADGSVHTVGTADAAVTDLVAGASVGSATLALAMPPPLLPLVVSTANGQWPRAAAPDWADADLRTPSPPPQA